MVVLSTAWNWESECYTTVTLNETMLWKVEFRLIHKYTSDISTIHLPTRALELLNRVEILTLLLLWYYEMHEIYWKSRDKIL